MGPMVIAIKTIATIDHFNNNELKYLVMKINFFE